MPRWYIKTLLVAEIAICFGPASLILCLGVLALPLWLSMLSAYLDGTVVPPEAGERYPWDLIWPIAVVSLGIVGLIGLMRVVTIVLRNKPHANGRVFTVACVLSGIASLALFNFTLGGIDPSEALLGSLIYTILPAIGAAHFMYLARAALFPGFFKSR
jgi:hypothetical protein